MESGNIMSQKFEKFNKFTLIKKIAHGGMAEIFLSCTGSIKQARRFVVLKRILPNQNNNKEFAKMFRNEGKIIANFNHSNVASIHEFGMANSQYFICMEYIQGRTLRQLTKKLNSQKVKFKIEHSAYIIKNVCLGLDYAHNYTDKLTGKPLHIIHRDISPQNIMISFNGEVKLIDFGIAKATNSEATKTGVLKGKFEYMSPEQVSGKDLNNQTDIFSLGIVLWELLNGEKLFSANNELAVLRKIKDFRLSHLKKKNLVSIPNQLINIIYKAIEPNKNMRYKTITEMSHDISIFLNTEYPKFTPTEFNKFIKNTYIEEMEEERIYLKSLATKLDEQEITKNTVLTKKTPNIINQNSSALLDKNEINNPSFIGQNPIINTQSELNDMNESEITSTLTVKEKTARTIECDNSKSLQYPNTKSSIGDPTSQITQTKFEDPLDDGPVNLKKKLTKNTPKNEITATEYLPYISNNELSAFRVKKHILAVKRKTRRKKMISVLVAFLLIGSGVAYFFKPKLPTKIEYTQLINRIYNDYFSNLIKTNDHKKSENQKKSEKISSNKSKRKLAGKPIPTKSIFLSTQPAGAFIQINGQSTTNITPFTLKIPSHKPTQLTIQKKGYYPKTIKLSKNSKNKLIIRLKRIDNQEYPNEVIMQ